MKTRLLCQVAIVLMIAGSEAAFASIYYVDVNASGANSGLNWTDAYTNLQNGMSAASSSDQIWVAKGTYYPTNGTDRNATFQLGDGVLLYGGFTNGMGTLGERDWTSHETILSGAIGAATNTDNSYHVVKGGAGATIDGATVANGYADGGGANDYGGGIYNATAALTVSNCVLRHNAAAIGGGGIYDNTGPLTVENCTLITNSTTTVGGFGGGVYLITSGSATLESCTFDGNSSDGTSGFAGGVYANGLSQLSILNTTFRGNSAGSYAASVYVISTAITITNCTFIGNVSTKYDGAGLYIGTGCSGEARDCIFANNVAGRWGAGIMNRSISTISDCKFIGNQTTSLGGNGVGIYSTAAMTVSNCVFVGNHGDVGNSAGGAIENYNAGVPVIKNCLFVGNWVRYYGGAIYNDNASPIIENCSFGENKSAYRGGAIQNISASQPVIKNCIFWNNTAPNAGAEFWNGGGSTCTVSYTDIEGGWNGAGVYNEAGSAMTDAGSNMNINPLFAGGTSGTWTVNGSYDPASGKTILTDGGKSWTVNELVGKTVNPNTTSNMQYYITANAATTITVWGDATSGASGASYQMYDYHLESMYGRWGYLAWVTDTTNSPCIDAGDPASPYESEPRHNGDRVNLGAYGNTREASLSKPPAGGMVIVIR